MKEKVSWQHSFQLWVQTIDIYKKQEAMWERKHELAVDKIFAMCCTLEVRYRSIGSASIAQVYKRFIDDNLTPRLEGQTVASKALNLDGKQGLREWLVRIC
ncbi:hypothetical protein VNO77_39378 [Canavalia gladiata]|uniref:Uncharacterized protein n=1 Tax=Canavalia gladiata TaxID=3824 RepID=A0AAN9PX31_CANGL